MDKVGIDASAKWITTPVGAAIGLTLARRGIPKAMRGNVSDILGTAGGAGAGYVAGDVIDSTRTSYPESPETYVQDIRKDPARFQGPATADEKDMALRLAPDSSKYPENAFGRRMQESNAGDIQNQLIYTARVRALESALQKNLIAPEQVDVAKRVLDINRKRLNNSKPNYAQSGIRGIIAGTKMLADMVFPKSQTEIE